MSTEDKCVDGLADKLGNKRILLRQGDAFYEARQYWSALSAYTSAVWCDHPDADAYIGRGNCLRELNFNKEAFICYDQAIAIDPQNVFAYLSKASFHSSLRDYGSALALYVKAGEILLSRGDYKQALESYDKALQLNPQLAQAYAGKGHAFFSMNRLIDALNAYEAAISFSTDDVLCYVRLGDILADIKCFNIAVQRYKQALQFDSDSVSAHLGLGNACFELSRYEEALSVYQRVVTLDAKNAAAYVRIGDIRTILKMNEDPADAYKKALELIQGEQHPDLLWSLAMPSRASFRPANSQFELLRHFIINAPGDTRTNEGLESIGKLYEHLFDPQRIPLEMLELNVRKLAQVLESLPEEKRAEALLLVANSEDLHTVHLLIVLAPYSLAGLGSLAHDLTRRLKPEPREDDLFVRFYHVLDSYNVPFEDSDWLLVQEMMAEKLYVQARSILTDLIKRRSTPDSLWLLARAHVELKETPHRQIEALQCFINAAPPSDIRRGYAWKRIGELYEKKLNNGIEAVKAYKEAEFYGFEFQQLQDFRTGNWEAIQALRTHPDFVFPAVIVIDLESAYQPDAPPGSCVFEVGAVCVKGGTELDTYQAIIQRDRVSPKVADRQNEAKSQGQVIRELRAFIEKSQWSIETALLVGHNLQAFDAPHLRAMGLPIKNDQIIDTLVFARLLYPDSLHHHLSLLCDKHQIPLEAAHHALADAQACSRLLHALGEELLRRGEKLIAGFRAFVPPGSAFDRSVLQPRNIAATPGNPWELDPTPTPPHVLLSIDEMSPSLSILEALEAEKDALVERYDPNAAYVRHLPSSQKSVVTVSTRARLERMLFVSRERSDLFVLPDPRTLLCPHRLRQCIEREENQGINLTLFCLYQASHNHDARTLYPLCISADDSALIYLKQILLEACCASDWNHADSCSAILAAKKATNTSSLLLATHESFLHQKYQPEGDLIIVDDADELQMHFAEYLAERVTDEQLLSWSVDVYKLLATRIHAYVTEHISCSAFHERIPVHRIIPYLTQPQDGCDRNLLTLLKEVDPVGEVVASKLEDFCQASLQEAIAPGHVHAYWLDLQFAHGQPEAGLILQQWSFCGLSRDLRQAFQQLFWQPYQQRIICGTAITLGALEDKFLKRFFGLPNGIGFLTDERPPAKVYIPTSDAIRPSSFLGRRPWAERAGTFLYRLAISRRESFVVTLHSAVIADALADAFKTHEEQVGHQILSPHLGWTTAKIADRLAMDERSAMAIISPYLRRAVLDSSVDIEVTGPMRFLNQRDPLVAAQMRAFAELYRNEGHFTAYLLPQALLELKARISSQAKMHVILDSALREAVYRDEVFKLFGNSEILDTLPDTSEEVSDSFLESLLAELERQGLGADSNVSDEDLYLTLQAFWGTHTFRESPLDQKEVVRSVLDGKDQLVVAATGGGKSLCFQLPAILLAQDVVPKVTLVISPLIALMRDQVEALRRKGVFSAVVLDSMLSSVERESYLQGIKYGDYSIIYIAPEQIRSSALQRVLTRRQVGLIAIDEAHCVSQWGHNFRTEYFALKKWIDVQICEGLKRSFPLLALTATARKGYMDSGKGNSEKGTIEDIVEKLGLQLTSEEVKLTSPERPELEFRVEPIMSQCPACCQALEIEIGEVQCPSCGRTYVYSGSEMKAKVRQGKLDKLISLLTDRSETGLCQRWKKPYGQHQRGIVYCRTVDETRAVAQDLIAHIPGLRVGIYHAGERITKEERQSVYQRFMSDGDDGLDIVVATNAFGMGIDARHLGFVIHFDVPATLEAYYQEAGRAGRDPEFQQGKYRAQCILFYHESDLENQLWLTSRNRITEQDIRVVYDAVCKLRNSGEQEILVTERDIELLSGIDTEKIATCLFYLEYHTRAEGAPVLERRENAAKLWQLKFEQGYRQRIVDPAISSLSKRLIEVFCSSLEFGLNNEETVIIDAIGLAAYIGWELSTLEAEVKNLVRRHIIAFASLAYVKWNKGKADSCDVIKQVIIDVINMLNNVEDRRVFHNGRTTHVNIQSLYDRGELKAVSLQVFTHYLFQLAHADAGYQRLFALFDKATDYSQQGYRLRLRQELQLAPAERIQDILLNIRKQLDQAVKRFGHDIITDQWHYIDLLREAPDYEERQQLKQSLQWLNILGLLAFPEEPERDAVMRVYFKQDAVSLADLKIDLSSLRLIERYGEKKLAIMREYAMLSQEQRSQLLLTYFFGERPLLEPFEIRADLTEEQRSLITVADGYHLVRGPAGSGKTTVLLEHFRYLVEQLLVPIDRILVTAHFNSATDRMSSNLEDMQKNGKRIPITTLNSLGERVFRQHRQLLKWIDGQPYYHENVEVKLVKGSWNEREDKEIALISSALERLHQEKWIRESLPADLGRLDLPETYKRDASKERNCLEAISWFRSLGIFPGCFSVGENIRITLEHTAREDKSLVINDLSFYYAVYIAYQLVQREQRVYTYDDQILFALAILKTNPEIAEQYQRSYEHIIIDEFQDLTPAEVELVGILSHKHRNVLAVGDLRQRIRFKQSEDVFFDQAFELLGDEHSVREHYLTRNFRSVQEILNFANALLPRYSDNTQIAARGLRGVKPCIIHVNTPAPSLLRTDEEIDDHLLYAMVDAALYQVEALPDTDAASVTLMVARSKWSHRVQSYLRKIGRAFSVLENTHHYQSYYARRVLTYFRLIYDKNQGEEVERLLRLCIVPYFETSQIRKLKELAEMRGQALLNAVLDRENLRQVDATEEQEAALLRHMAVLEKHCAGTVFEEVWQSISELSDGPIAQATDHPQEDEELEIVLNELRGKSVKQALEHIDSHITFLEEHRTTKDLVVTTIDYAKSQDFDTVFLLGAHILKDRRRWYVSVTRARQRFFCLVNAQPSESRKNNDILSSIPREFYDELSWP